MPVDPNVEGGNREAQELHRALCAVEKLPHIRQIMDARYESAFPPFDVSRLALGLSQLVQADDDDLSSIGSDPAGPAATVEHVEYVKEEEAEEDEEVIIRQGVQNLLQAAEEAALDETSSLPPPVQTPIFRPVNQRTIEWVRSLETNLPETPEKHNFTPTSTSPARPRLPESWDSEYDPDRTEIMSEQTPDINRQKFQYMSHNNRWCVPRMTNPLVHSIERDRPDQSPYLNHPALEDTTDSSVDVKQELNGDDDEDEGELTPTPVKKERESEEEQVLENIPRHAAAPSTPSPPAPPPQLESAAAAPAEVPPGAQTPTPRRYSTRSTTANKVTKKYHTRKTKRLSKGCKSKHGDYDDDFVPSSHSSEEDDETQQEQPLRRSSRIAALTSCG
ncbi:hypothetical protein VTN00DRAFT_5057 [Thermoascus crustaceus]|uniref:uncharacterized protein n=1 Tax=Thermoascus crustaceus TaxID=5088 RepID=UPI00374279C9